MSITTTTMTTTTTTPTTIPTTTTKSSKKTMKTREYGIREFYVDGYPRHADSLVLNYERS